MKFSFLLRLLPNSLADIASPGRRMVLGILLAALIPCALVAASDQRPVPKPLAGHPGNVFVTGEPVVVAMPPPTDEQGGSWQLLNYEGATVAHGTATNGQAVLGEFPVGYYELHRVRDGVPEQQRTTIGVLAPLWSPTPRTSPIGVDVATAWLCSKAQYESAANLCALAGINWARDRYSWQEMEPERGRFAPATKYDDSARAFTQAGLQVLQVHHDSPAWASTSTKRFPLDLRDAYRFAREMARRWQVQVLAFEPWNEGDLEPFGGHTGSELAAFQKASYLGFKAGNPAVIVCQNVFASPQPNVLADFNANQAWPYFDTFNLHHYCPLEEYPGVYAAFRAVSAGRPMWVTEFSIPVKWAGDASAQEPTGQDLRVQAERVTQVFASSLFEGPVAVFYFIVPHYTEGQTQFGLLHKDLTPRPGYLALAAVGRLLADAKPLGRLRPGGAVRAFGFRARPDGQERDVLVAWTTGGQATLELPATPLALFDHLGRSLTNASRSISISAAPIFAVCKKNSLRPVLLEPSPVTPEQKPGKPSPVVLQVVTPKDKLVASLSAYACSSAKPEVLSVFAYNFSSAAVAGDLTVTFPAGWSATLPRHIELSPGERKELALSLDCRAGLITPAGTVRITGDFGPAGEAVASFQVTPQPFTIRAGVALPIHGAEEANRWQPTVSTASDLKISGSNDGGVTFNARLAAGERWVYPRLVLGEAERVPANCIALAATLTAVEGKAKFRAIFEEENLSAYFTDFYPQPKPGESVEAVAALASATFGLGWSKPDDNGRLDLEKIRAIRVGCNPTGDSVICTIKNLRWLKPKPPGS